MLSHFDAFNVVPKLLAHKFTAKKMNTIINQH